MSVSASKEWGEFQEKYNETAELIEERNLVTTDHLKELIRLHKDWLEAEFKKLSK